MGVPLSISARAVWLIPNTVTAARVHSMLFGRGGTPSSKFKFKRQCVSPSVLEEPSEFFMRDNVSRPSSCRSIVVNGQESPVRYWKDYQVSC